MSRATYPIEKWESHYSDIGIDNALKEKYISFVQRCYQKKIPPIFELEHLSLLLGIGHDNLLSMIFSTKNFYRRFKIRKRSGGFREISAPLPSLLEAQRWINEFILESVKVSICATGFRPNKSIITNAKLHCNRSILFKLDIKDFFPRITFKRVMSIFLEIGYPLNVAFALSRLCCEDGKLPQGAATSPALANIACRRLDSRLYNLAKKQKLRYTRYADDIVVSGEQIDIGIRKLIIEIISQEDFIINKSKTRIVTENRSKIVTGLDISSGSPRVTRSYRREIKKDVYFVWSAGLANHLARRRIFQPNYIYHLAGRLQFWSTVEPHCTQMLLCKSRMREILKLYEDHQIQLRIVN